MDRSSNAGVYHFCNKVDTSRQSPCCKFGKCTNMKQGYGDRYKDGQQNNDLFDGDWEDEDGDWDEDWDETDEDEDEDYGWNGEQECYAHFMVDWDILPEDAIVSIV